MTLDDNPMVRMDETHTYWHGDRRVPGVTSALKPLLDFSRIDAFDLEAARQKGVAVHKMVEQWAKGELDEGSLPEWMVPVLAHWKKFASETRLKVIASERLVFHPIYEYAGTLDLFCEIHGKPAFVDVKRSFFAGAVTGLQLAAYQNAYVAQHREGKDALRFALRLREDGPYRMEQFEDRSDFTTFLALLTIKRWGEKHGHH